MNLWKVGKIVETSNLDFTRYNTQVVRVQQSYIKVTNCLELEVLLTQGCQTSESIKLN